MEIVKSTRGGAREGAGRPKKEAVRKQCALRAYPEEWEIIKRFAAVIKRMPIEKAEKIILKIEKDVIE